jgi:hypothetical protein
MGADLGQGSKGSIDRPLAIRVVEALRQGSNCLEEVERFSAGRELLFRAADDLLDELEVSNGASVRWIKGSYGQGKTHFFARLLDLAHARNWVTTYVVVSGRGEGTELHRFEEIYASILRNCLCRDLVKEERGRIEPGRISGWAWILDNWFDRLRRLAVGRRDGDTPSFLLRDQIEQSMTSMRNKANLHGSFAEALRQYAYAKADTDEEWRALLLEWFSGANVHSQGGATRRRLKECGIREPVSRRNAKEMLRSISGFLGHVGFGGILILLDEVENVLHQTPNARRTAYTILRELIDNVDDRHGMTRAAFYVAGTPDLFESATGLTEYEALAERVLLETPGALRSPVSTVLDLAGWPLTRDDFGAMARSVLVLHAIAKSWEPSSNCVDEIDALLAQTLERNPDLSPRLWMRTVVAELDRRAAEARYS